MKGKLVTYIDQYRRVIVARTVKELRESAGGGRVSKMYVDKKDGSVAHVGYIVGQSWFMAFVPYEVKQ